MATQKTLSMAGRASANTPVASGWKNRMVAYRTTDGHIRRALILAVYADMRVDLQTDIGIGESADATIQTGVPIGVPTASGLTTPHTWWPVPYPLERIVPSYGTMSPYRTIYPLLPSS